MMQVKRTVWSTWTSLVALAAIVVWVPAAQGELFVDFDLSKAQLVYSAADKTLTVSETGLSVFDVTYQDTASGILDIASFVRTPDKYDFVASLKLIDLSGTDRWAATGTLTFTDINSGNAVEAQFASSRLEITAGGSGDLKIEGLLCPFDSADSILVNRGDPWTFVGDSAVTPSSPDADGTQGQITVKDPDTYGSGTLAVFKFGVGTLSEDMLFSEDRTLMGGEAKGSIVPAPAAVVLGMIGLGIVGWIMRRFA